jgi:hypothetical protein
MATLTKTRIMLSEAMEKHEPFKRGNLSGERFNAGEYVPIGRLPRDYVSQIRQASHDNDLYVVYSYGTPIAWCKCDGKDEWVKPDVKYSVTTTHHQSLITVEIHHPGFWQRFKRTY